MVNNIGEITGRIWDYLNANGETSLANLKKTLDLKPEQVTMSLGWLAREDKVNFEKKGNSIKVSIK
ncbi:MAG: hypothetical protein A2287_08140 [Candidatus Melainabacteria bacterium RIFOXYA12_FULL_32_12]|nr:MAG: hypothetical protein A2287_08140 [Candidatus Melainabacteria bacterium RIFOXYA12_FULL_32_12]